MSKDQKLGHGLGELEAEVMKIIWRSSQPLAGKYVHQEIQKNRAIAYTTVLTVMVRLCKKNVLIRTPAANSYLYTAKVSKQVFLEAMTKSFFSQTMGVFGDEVISHFIKELKSVDAVRRQRLLQLLEETT